MLTHDQFEQMCVLAAAGELPVPEVKLLDDHLRDCEVCRDVLADMREIHAQWLPEYKSSGNAAEMETDWVLRQMILKQAAKEGAHFSDEALAVPVIPQSLFPYGQFAALSAALILCIVAGVLAGEWHVRRNEKAVATVPTLSVRPQNISSDANRAAEVLRLQQAKEMIEEQLRTEESRNIALTKELEEEKSLLQASGEENATNQAMIAELKQEIEAGHTRERDLEAQLDGLKGADEVANAAQQEQIEQLKAKLVSSNLSLERERSMLSAGREIRDLIAARNLHIIDVYDTNGEGKTSQAFGRVFYTEGKSLVFYAYDLAGRPNSGADFAFYVWGKRDGAPHEIKNLGRMNKDEQGQKRWALTITDPKVLAEIDSVFVTLEPDHGSNKPSGKPLLSAFLGSPANHP